MAREHPQISTVSSHSSTRCPLPLCCLGALWQLPARRTCGNLESTETEKSLRKIQEIPLNAFLNREF